MPEDKEKQIWEERLIAYLHEELDANACQEVETWLAEYPEHKDLYREICSAYYSIRWNLQEKAINAENARKRLQHVWKRRKIQHKSYAIAVICILLLAVGSLLWRNEMSTHQTSDIQTVSKEKRLPQVMLLLSDGSSIALDRPKEVLVASEDSLTITVDSCGQIHYTNIHKTTNNYKLYYNTLIVPRGGEYFIVLNDGTKVWIGADSHFEYPITFEGDKRIVKLKGEAYFEVAKDSLHPFIVYSDKFQMQVYGTEFNLNTYNEKRIQLALVRGSVGFKTDASVEEIFLHPGQLGEINVQTGESCVQYVNIKQYTSWKDGYVIFENECLESIMEKLSRWYNVDVFFENEDLKKTSFYGNLRRYEDMEKFLSCLQKVSNINFQVHKGSVIVKRK